MESISAIRTVAAFGQERGVIGKYRSAVTSACQRGIRQGAACAALEGVMAPLIFVLFGLGFLFGAKLITDDMEAKEYCRFVSSLDATSMTTMSGVGTSSTQSCERHLRWAMPPSHQMSRIWKITKKC